VLAFERPGDDRVVVLLNTADGADRIVAQSGTILVETGGVVRQADGMLLLPPDSACWLSAP
jgi:hypothetical protein